jgi:hypothetical protein
VRACTFTSSCWAGLGGLLRGQRARALAAGHVALGHHAPERHRAEREQRDRADQRRRHHRAVTSHEARQAFADPVAVGQHEAAGVEAAQVAGDAARVGVALTGRAGHGLVHDGDEIVG